MISFFDVFIFWVFFLGLTMSLTQVFKKITSGLSLFFTVSILSIGLWGLQIALYSTRVVIGYEISSTFLIPLSFFAAASNPMRYQWLIQKGYHLEKTYYLYYIPFIVSILYLAPVMIHSSSEVNDYLRFSPLITGEFLKLPPYYLIIQLFYPLAPLYQVTLALVIILRNLDALKDNSSEHNNRVSHEAIKTLLLITLSIFCIFIGNIFSMMLTKWSLIFCALSLFSTLQNSIRNPIYNKLMRLEVDKVRQSSSKIRSLDIDSIINKLTDIMENEKAFAAESISLKDTADELGLSVHQLSEILNKKLGKNFNSYINEYRINEAKHMLVNEPRRSVQSIGTAVGFNALSTFTSVFKRIVGCSPKEYRRIMARKK